MSDEYNLLLTILYNGELLQCALKVKKDKFEDHPYWMEGETREALRALLPLHVQSCGPIVRAEEIFEVCKHDPSAEAGRGAGRSPRRLRPGGGTMKKPSKPRKLTDRERAAKYASKQWAPQDPDGSYIAEWGYAYNDFLAGLKAGRRKGK